MTIEERTRLAAMASVSLEAVIGQAHLARANLCRGSYGQAGDNLDAITGIFNEIAQQVEILLQDQQSGVSLHVVTNEQELRDILTGRQ